MRAIIPILILCLIGQSCKSKPEKGPIVKSIQNPKFLQGAWYLYDAESNESIGNGPLFELAAHQRFVDSADILCHFNKLKTGDLLSLIRAHSNSTPRGERLKNCPNYLYEGDILAVQVYDSSERGDVAIVTIEFADMKRRTILSNGRSGKLYYLYAEMKNSSPMVGAMLFSPGKAQVNRVPVVLVRSP